MRVCAITLAIHIQQANAHAKYKLEDSCYASGPRSSRDGVAAIFAARNAGRIPVVSTHDLPLVLELG